MYSTLNTVIYLQLYDVEAGDAIMINWISHLKAVTAVHHSAASGKPLVHISADSSVFHKPFIAISHNKNKPWVCTVFHAYLKFQDDSNLAFLSSFC